MPVITNTVGLRKGDELILLAGSRNQVTKKRKETCDQEEALAKPIIIDLETELSAA